MEWKTSTSGQSTLSLESDEEAWLRRAATERGQSYPDALQQFEHLRRSQPHAEFTDLAKLFLPGTKRYPALVIDLNEQKQDPEPDLLGDLIALDAQIRTAFKSASSMQTEAVLLGARATCLQGIALTNMLCALFAILEAPNAG